LVFHEKRQSETRLTVLVELIEKVLGFDDFSLSVQSGSFSEGGFLVVLVLLQSLSKVPKKEDQFQLRKADERAREVEKKERTQRERFRRKTDLIATLNRSEPIGVLEMNSGHIRVFFRIAPNPRRGQRMSARGREGRRKVVH